MKIAVSGGSGFVGRHVLRALAGKEGLEVMACSRSELREKLPSPAMRHVKLDHSKPSRGDYEALGRPDVLIHLAWEGLPNYKSLHHFESELPRQYAFLRSLLDAGLPSLVVAGTCYEYGMRCGAMDESTAACPANPYAFAKNALREQLELRRSVHGFALTWARLFYMHGEDQAPTSLYPQLMAAIERGDATFKMSGGEQLRDFLPVSEVAGALVELAVGTSGAGTVNVCSGRPVSIRSLVERWLAERGASIALELGHYPYPDFEPMAFWGKRGKLDALLAQRGISR
jgi:nucleoside-diphosphate-sugar epimerase